MKAQPWRKNPVILVTGIILFLLAVFVFGLLAHEVVKEKEDWFDTSAFKFLKSYSSPGFISFFSHVTFLGSTMFLLPAYVILVSFLIYKGQRAAALHTALVGLLSTLLMFGLKTIIARTRPELPLMKELGGYSFPSGHTLSSFVFCCVLTWLLWKLKIQTAWKVIIAAILVLTTAAIAISRIVLRYHYASDVVAGLCLAVAFVQLYFFIAGFVSSSKKDIHHTPS